MLLPTLLATVQTLSPRNAAFAEKAWAYSARYGGATMLVMVASKIVDERYGGGRRRPAP